MDFEKLCWENFKKTGDINFYRLYSAVTREQDERNNNESNSNEDNSLQR